MNTIKHRSITRVCGPWIGVLLAASEFQEARADDLNDFNAGNINGWQTFDIGQMC